MVDQEFQAVLGIVRLLHPDEHLLFVSGIGRTKGDAVKFGVEVNNNLERLNDHLAVMEECRDEAARMDRIVLLCSVLLLLQVDLMAGPVEPLLAKYDLHPLGTAGKLDVIEVKPFV